MKKVHKPRIYNSLIELNRDLGLPEPLHPLITISDFSETDENLSADISDGVMMNFYQISFKDSFSGTIRYGEMHYDFANGGLSFTAPNQLLGTGGHEDECEGSTLLIHPDFLKGSSLAAGIRDYNFFSYTANESLHLSQKEKEVILAIFSQIKEELVQRIDKFSQKIIISHIESLLNYSDRFYHRQFMTRISVNEDLLTRMESLLASYFNSDEALRKGLPTVQYLAEKLLLSPGYLSDMLRSLTGLNAQQHIHQKMIEKAKEYLALGHLSVSEISYLLGFEHPQSFSKIFKKKTDLSPNEYRHSLN
ncbi:AraC family transcriptional regulator [Chitinophaga sp. S165]|uniref:helix-turn-helix domain-containing protein n=1 Tax=Chitinophaga sp. S165 TaxID=2135462 RepID=UPI000D71B1D2|nr:response regulator transcription factor [Chitinophaga sp. S165]PWV56336.1 helix-turn-helix protein [Chitinophaga sp. S165]